MKKIIIILAFLISSLFSFDVKQVDFATYCYYMSFMIDKNIILADDVPSSISVYMPKDEMSKKEAFKSLLTIINSKKLHYKIVDNTMIIYKSSEYQPVLKQFVIKFNYIKKEVLTNYLKSFFPNVKYQIFQNRLIIFSTFKQYKSIKKAIDSLQSSFKKAPVNFIISVINNKKAKEYGVNLNIKSPFKNLIELVTDTTVVNSTFSDDFSSFIKFLNSKGLSETLSKPTITLIDSSDYTLESVHSIPYITKSVTINKDGLPVTQTDLKYKDIGLKIYIKNVFITEDNIDFDMDIYIENIVSFENDQPITDTKHFNTHVQLTPQKPYYLIAGLRSVTKLTDKSAVPGLQSIPMLGYLFKNEKVSVEDLSFTFYISTQYFKNLLINNVLKQIEENAKRQTREERP